jgi:hypothetical protein
VFFTARTLLLHFSWPVVFSMSQLLKFALWTCIASVGMAGCGGSDPMGATENQLPALDQSDDVPQNDGTGQDSVPFMGTAVGPEGDSNVKVGELRFPLKSALGDIWGIEGDHYNVDFTITNGKFLVVPTDIDGVTHSLLLPVESSATIYVELYSPGDAFSFGTYSFSPFGAGGGVLAGNAYFDGASVGVDSNESGDIEPNENFKVIGGTFEFIGALPDLELRFSVTLENGQLAEGHYTGLFDFADRS